MVENIIMSALFILIALCMNTYVGIAAILYIVILWTYVYEDTEMKMFFKRVSILLLAITCVYMVTAILTIAIFGYISWFTNPTYEQSCLMAKICVTTGIAPTLVFIIAAILYWLKFKTLPYPLEKEK